MWICGAVLLCSCSPAEDPAAVAASKIRRVIMISIDTLRADALGSYGNAASPSPNLDRFASQGVRFETCIAPSPLTLPSHATLLTGLHPLEHGLLINSQSSLSGSVATLAEILQAEGWKTGAVVSSAVLHHRYGLDRGFSNYSDDLFSGVLDHTETQAIASGNARAATLAAIDWLSSQPPDERLFLFLHYIDPHAPYDPPARFDRAFPDDGYLAEVAYTDNWIGRLAGFLQENGLLSGTLFVITADHGEARGQHGMQTHGYFLYDEVLRVPLIFAGGGLPSGVVATNPVGLIDVVPTLLSSLNLPVPPDLSGRNILADLSASDPDRALVSVSYEPALAFGWSPLWSLWTRDEKLVLAPRPEYFVRASDPDELDDLADTLPERVRDMEHTLRERASAYLTRYHRSVPVDLDLATAQQLIALGYSAPARNAEFDLEDFSGRDPKDMRALILRTDDYHAAVSVGDYELASAILDEIASVDPDIPSLKEDRSFLFLVRGQEAELLEWIDRMPADFQASATQRYHRAVALGRLGRGEEAMALLREMLAQAPEDSLCRFELARLLSQTGEPEAAMREYQILLNTAPRSRAARLNYARLLKLSGDRLAAVLELRALVEMHPTYARAVRNLGLDLAGIGDRRGAIAMLERAIELAPHANNRARTEEIIAELKTPR